MNAVNHDDVIQQLRGADLIIPGHLQMDKITRVDVNGMREKQRGWYSLHQIDIDGEVYIVGTFGVWRGNDSGTMKVELTKRCEGCGRDIELKAKKCPHCNHEKFKRREVTPEQAAALKARIEADKKRAAAIRQREIEEASAKAQARWAGCVAEGESAYLKRKNIAGHGVRYENGHVVVPMCDASGRIFGLQIIAPQKKDGRDKDFWPAGMQMKGSFHLIGLPKDRIILVAEGYATAATIHEATGQCVAVAFNANNLQPVAVALAKRYKTSRILICADDDHGTEGNPGVKSGELAKIAVDGAMVVPQFSVERDKKDTDFNDLARLDGVQVVAAQIDAAIADAGWSSAEPLARGIHPQGGGGKQALPSMLQVDEALQRFSLVYGGGGTFFDHAEHMLVPKSDVMDILPEHGWRDMRAHKRVVRISEVGFDPAGTDPAIRCNLWGGWPTTPKAGGCKALLDLLEYLCTGEQNHREVFQWVLKWVAYPIQHPGAKMRTALIFHGPQGAGKNLFFEAVMAIYGEYGRIVDQSAIEDKFNDWASRKLFLIADEVVARAELFHVKNKLKHLVTGEWIRINPKNVAAHDEKNHVNLVFLSNEHQPLVLERDDRRYTVIWTPDKLPPEFYQIVRDEINAGGIEALHQYLLDLDLGDFNEHSKPPMTEAKRDLIDVSMGSTERFITEWKSGDAGLPFCPCASSDLYAAYMKWCRAEGVMRPRENQQFMAQISKLPGWYKGHKDTFNDYHFTGKTSRRRMVLPSDDDLNAAAAAGRKDFRKPDYLTQAQWLTECFLAFNEAISDQSPHGAHA